MRILPVTRLAWVAVAVDAVAIAIYAGFLLASDGPDGGNRMLGLGPPLLAMAAASVLALIAIARRGERALLAWIALVPGGLVVLALIAEATGLME